MGKYDQIGGRNPDRPPKISLTLRKEKKVKTTGLMAVFPGTTPRPEQIALTGDDSCPPNSDVERTGLEKWVPEWKSPIGHFKGKMRIGIRSERRNSGHRKPIYLLALNGNASITQLRI